MEDIAPKYINKEELKQDIEFLNGYTRKDEDKTRYENLKKNVFRKSTKVNSK